MFVTVTSVAAMLVMASVPADNMELARKAYNNCVTDNMIVQLDKSADADAYEKSLKGICAAEQKQFVAAIIQYERSEGASASEAKEIAEVEVQIVLEDSVEYYAEHSAEGTRPEKEA